MSSSTPNPIFNPDLNSDPRFTLALSAIDAAHACDPTLHTLPSGTTLPAELHYAHLMTSYLSLHTPTPSALLSLAVRAQHLRRWEIPRSSYPPTKIGYHSWRTALKIRQAALVTQICIDGGYSADEAGRVGALVRKEGLRGEAEAEVQALEDVACLVFLREGLEDLERGVGDEEKMVGILRRTWGKMGERGRELARGLEIGEGGRRLLEKALGPGQGG